MAVTPMRKVESLRNSTPDIDELRDDLEAIGAALGRLLRRAETADSSRHPRFVRYLVTLERMYRDTAELLDDRNPVPVAEAARGVEEAWARLAIARSAAEARFGPS